MQRGFWLFWPFPFSRRRHSQITQQFLIDTGIILASSLDYQTTLNTVAHLATGSIADWCVIDLVDASGAMQRVAVAHRNPDKEQLARQLQLRYPAISADASHTLMQVLKKRESWFDPQVSISRLKSEARDEEHWRLLSQLGFRSEIVVPLVARDKALGTLTLVVGEKRRRYDHEDLILAEELARRVALAIDNARLYQEAETQREQVEVMMTRYRDLVENANDIIYTLDLDSNLTSINRVGLEITGYEPEEILNKHISQIVTPAYIDRMREMFDHKTQHGGRTRYELEIITKDGRTLTLEINSQLVTHGGRPVGVQGIARDITERKRTEAITAALYAAEQQARTRAEEANLLKLKFLAMVSHELRTPLTSIKGFATTLLAEDVVWDADSQTDFLRIIDQETDKLAGLVDELLDLSRLHVGSLSIVPEMQTLTHILKIARPELDALSKNHRLVIEVDADLPPLAVDTRRIVQVMTNLVSNAAKYSPVGTTIHLSAHPVNNHVQVDVADEGRGILPEHRTLVFEAFRQIERKTDSPIKGAGLGLAICKGLVEAHGGQIWVGEKTPPGALFSFTLPITSTEIPKPI